MDENLRLLHESYPTTCIDCNGVCWPGTPIFLQLKTRPFLGDNPSIMLLGQDPTLKNRTVKVVLDLGSQNSRLRNWLEKEIFEEAGIDIGNIYATNAIKCTLSTRPADLAKKIDIHMVDFLDPYFSNCKRFIANEVRTLNPSLLIALGEPVHQLLVRYFGWQIPEKMRKAFGSLFDVSIEGIGLIYVPCIHDNTWTKSYYRSKWPDFIAVLSAILKKIG